MQTAITNSLSRDIADDSIILNILPLDERKIINHYFADESAISQSHYEIMIAA